MGHDDDFWAVNRLVRGAWVTMCLRAMVELGLPDAMDAPYDVETLADRVGADPDALVRLLRAIVDADLMQRDDGGRWSLTARGRVPAQRPPERAGQRGPDDHVGTQAAHLGADRRRRPHRARHLRGGQRRASSWEIMSQDQNQAAVFNAAMARRGTMQADTIREACDLADIERVVDVGGGTGALLEALLSRDPGLRGVLADRPHVVAEAERRMAAAHVADRCEIVGVDFFAEVPTGGDAYVLSNILHDWPDEDCLRILRGHSCGDGARRAALGARDASSTRTRPDRPSSRPTSTSSTCTCSSVRCRERTSAEYDALLTAAGFDPARRAHPVRPLERHRVDPSLIRRRVDRVSVYICALRFASVWPWTREPGLLDALSLLSEVADELVVRTARDTHDAWADRVHGLTRGAAAPGRCPTRCTGASPAAVYGGLERRPARRVGRARQGRRRPGSGRGSRPTPAAGSSAPR